MVQIHPPQPNYSSTYGRSRLSALSTSTKASTNSIEKCPSGLRRSRCVCDLSLSPAGPNLSSLVWSVAVQRQVFAAVDCYGTAMKKDSTEVISPLFTEREAACYLSRSRSSLRRDRKDGSGPGFIRIGRSIRYLRSDLDLYISACRRAGTAEVHRG